MILARSYQNKTENFINRKNILAFVGMLEEPKKFSESNLLDRIGIQVPQNIKCSLVLKAIFQDYARIITKISF